MNKKFKSSPKTQNDHNRSPLLSKTFTMRLVRSTVGATLVVALRVVAIARFSIWSLRHRAGQLVPVAAAFLLLVSAAQTIGILHDISSVSTQQKIAQSWRYPYDLFVRPPSAVNQPERSAGWIDPQSVLESYGGISARQVASIRSLPHIIQVTPFANLGWQSIDVQLPVELLSRGVYRVSAAWGSMGEEVVRYVDVTDLAHLTTETPLSNLIVEHLIARDDTTPVVFPMSLQAAQALIGIPASQQKTLTQVLLEGIPPVPPLHLAVHIDKLNGGLNILAACVKRSGCWKPQQVRYGTLTYQPAGVQLLRYSRTPYSSTPQQLAAGQVSISSLGEDIQGQLYRLPLPDQISLPNNIVGTRFIASHAVGWEGNVGTRFIASHAVRWDSNVPLLPLSALEHLPLLMNAVRFIPLEQACQVNGTSCYSGLFLRLNGVEHYNQNSLALLQATAAAITAHTGLHVDILDGSSSRSVALAAPPSNAHSLVLSSWRVVGVAVQIVHGLDALQETLLILCSIVCLLAIGAAGILVGIGRRKEALLLLQIGWQRYLLLLTFTLDALFLCLPGCLLAIAWMVFAATLWSSTLPTLLLWALLTSGILVYCFTLVSTATQGYPQKASNPRQSKLNERSKKDIYAQSPPPHTMSPHPKESKRSEKMESQRTAWKDKRSPQSKESERSDNGVSAQSPLSHATSPQSKESERSEQGVGTRFIASHGAAGQADPQIHLWDAIYRVPTPWRRQHTNNNPFIRLRPIAKTMPILVSSIAITAAVFLIAIEYVLLTSFNQVLTVTVLGRQVREGLEAPQLVLLLLILLAALLTVGLCTLLLLRGRRQELSLLAMVGWERHRVLLRLMRESWWAALVSGEIGALLALAVTALTGTLPSLLIIVGLLVCGPLIAVVLVSMVTTGPAWQETKRVFVWK